MLDSIPSGAELTVSVNLIHALGNIDIYLFYSLDGSTPYLVASSESTTDFESISYVDAAEGLYYVLVYNLSASPSPYSFLWNYTIP